MCIQCCTCRGSLLISWGSSGVVLSNLWLRFVCLSIACLVLPLILFLLTTAHNTLSIMILHDFLLWPRLFSWKILMFSIYPYLPFCRIFWNQDYTNHFHMPRFHQVHMQNTWNVTLGELYDLFYKHQLQPFILQLPTATFRIYKFHHQSDQNLQEDMHEILWTQKNQVVHLSKAPIPVKKKNMRDLREWQFYDLDSLNVSDTAHCGWVKHRHSIWVIRRTADA